jgi:hypothetical protein
MRYQETRKIELIEDNTFSEKWEGGSDMEKGQH